MPKQTKRDRKEQARRGRAKAHDAVRRRQQYRRLGYAAAGVALVLAVAVLVASWGGGQGGSGAIKPSLPGQIEVSAPARTGLIPEGESAPSFSAPGFRIVKDPSTGDLTVQREHVDWSPGAPTVIVLWASWCPHCQSELPVIGRVAADFPAVSLITITTSIGAHPGPTPNGYLADAGLTLPVAIDDAEGTLAQAFGLRYFPTIYFIASDGTVAKAWEGDLPEAQLRELIGSLT
jgi:thiol-disulfide isomerase/thioredoxin